MAMVMLDLFKEYKKISRQKEEAYNKVYASRTDSERRNWLKKAHQYAKQLDNKIREINKQADKEGISTKRRGKRR